MAKQWLGTKPFVEYTSTTGGTQPVTYDTTGSGGATAGSSNANTATITWTHSAIGGANCVVVIGIMVGSPSVSAGGFSRSATYGGTAMTFATYGDTFSASGWTEIYYLQNPPSGPQTISYTVSKASTTIGRVAGNSVSYANVGSVGNAASGNVASTATFANVRAMWASLNANSMAGTMVFGIAAVDSSQTISAFAISNSLAGTLPLPPVQGSTTRFTGNSGAATSVTSYAIGDSPGGPYLAYNVSTASAALLTASLLCLNPVGVAVPKGITGCWLTMIGAGGGGASGRQGATATARFGGDGGGGGALVAERYVPVALLSSTYSVYVPPAPSGGAAQATANTNGNAGVRALDVLFGSGNTNIVCGSGHGGQGGGIATNTYLSRGGLSGDMFGFGGNGGQSTNGVGGDGSASTFGGTNFISSGGGAGGGLSTSNVAGNGGAGGGNSESSLTGGAAGVVGGTSPQTGSVAMAGIEASGSGGGAASVSGAPQNGANAIGYGAGGGGGGASLNTQNSGAGGNGGPAYVRIMWDYR